LAEPLFSYRGRVYWSDTDAAQIAHFSSFFRYCERAEEEFIVSRLGGWRRGGIVFPRVRAECDFRAPMYPHDLFRVDIVGARVGRKSITYEFRVYNESRGWLAAEGSIVVVAFDPVRGEAVPVPEELRRLLEGASQA